MLPYYKNDLITLYHGDCFEILPKLAIKFDAIIADLPYGITPLKWDKVFPLARMWEQYEIVTYSTSPIVLFGSQPFTSMLVMSKLNWFRCEWVWDKKQSSGGTLSDKFPMKAHESILIFSKNKTVYNPQYIPWSSYDVKRMSHNSYKVPKSSLTYADRETKPRKERIKKGKMPQSVLRINALNRVDKERVGHPTQKPEELMRYLIRTYTNEGDIILDNTCGSGTTLVAAMYENRRAVGIELDKKWCDVCVKRFNLFSNIKDNKEEFNWEDINDFFKL